ncbi:MAG: hypothetical protein ACPG31_08780, partial [Planctomycetota bacterium]
MRYFIKIAVAILALAILGYLAFQTLFIPTGPGPELQFLWREGETAVADLQVRVWQGDGETYVTRTTSSGGISIPEGGPRAMVLVGNEGKVATQLFAINAESLGPQVLKVDPAETVKVRITTDEDEPLAGEMLFLRHCGAWGASADKPSLSVSPELNETYWFESFKEHYSSYTNDIPAKWTPPYIVLAMDRLSAGQRRSIVYDMTATV